MESVTDICYIKRIQAGETECFTFLLERHSRSVYSLIVKIAGSREDAEELTQDVFLKAYRSLDSFQGNSSFSTWLYRIAYNTAVSATRKKKHEWLAVEESAIENVADDDVNDALSQGSNEERLERLEQALEQLLPGERALILLFYMQEKTVEEITIVTGLTVSNIKTKLHRIRKKMFVWMKAMEKNNDY